MRCVRLGIVLGVWGLVVAALAADARADAKVEEQVVGPASEQGTIYAVSPRGMHVATVSMKGSRWVVTLDGAEGPPFDAIMLQSAAGVEVTEQENGIRTEREAWVGPIAFSPDGSRMAYAARAGKDAVVMLDGKEVFRAPFSETSVPKRMSFTPDGKHLYFLTQTVAGGVQLAEGGPYTQGAGSLVFDGQPGPPTSDRPTPFFSADGSHWGYTGMDPARSNQRFMIIDGKDPGYSGERPEFTPDGAHVVCIGQSDQNGKQALLLDGRPSVSADRIENFAIGATGDVAAVATIEGRRALYLNGKPVPGGEDAVAVKFSPDGKHWAARCEAPPRAWVVTDGTKGQEYGKISDLAFSPDSSKCLYVAEVGSKKFVVVNGQEEPGNTFLQVRPIFAATGNHYAYTGGDGPGSIKAYYDGKPLPQSYLVFGLTLSPDGTRHAYYGASDALNSMLVVDGDVKGSAGGQGGQPMFSPDGKHVVAAATSPKNRDLTMYVDGGFMAAPSGFPKFCCFTNDSQHLLTEGGEDSAGGPGRAYYLDGKRVALFSGLGVSWQGGMPKLWEAQDDGTIVLVGAEPKGTSYGAMKRVRITPDPAHTVATMVSDYEAAQAQAKADAEAAAKKKADEVKAAQEKAMADAKAAQEKALADRKAAYDKAVAERQAAYEKAMAERKAAQEKAAAERAAKQAAGK